MNPNVRFEHDQNGMLVRAYCIKCGWSDNCPFIVRPQPKSGISQFKKEAHHHLCKAQGAR